MRLNYRHENGRAYQITLETDLLNDLTLTTFNSGAFSKGVRRRIHVQTSIEGGLRAFAQAHQKRVKRKYQVIN